MDTSNKPAKPIRLRLFIKHRDYMKRRGTGIDIKSRGLFYNHRINVWVCDIGGIYILMEKVDDN